MPKLKQIKSTIENASRGVSASGAVGPFSVSAGPNGISISANFSEKIKNKLSTSRRASGPLKKLYTGGSNVKDPLIFPTDLDNEHYMIYNVVKRDRPSREVKGTKQIIRSIVLPLPNNIQTSYNAQYSETALGLLGGMAAGQIDMSAVGSALGNKVIAGLQGINTSDITDAVSNVELPSLDSALKGIGTAVASTTAAAGYLAVGGTLGNPSEGIMYKEGLAVNPHMAVTFTGMGFKSHSFSYRLIARNQQESELITRIITAFKYYMHPDFSSTVGNLAFTYPDEFTIQFSDAVQPHLYKIGTSVLKTFSVNYNGENTPLFYENTGAPVVVDISMEFQENRIQTRGAGVDAPEEGTISAISEAADDFDGGDV